MIEPQTSASFKILCLDGGGAKGFYTLGFLREFEAVAGRPLGEFFDAIYGTSTGAIIASLIGLGKSVTDTLGLYEKHVLAILGPKRASERSTALLNACEELYGNQQWMDFKTRIGIVATNWTQERPLVFKNFDDAAHSMRATFIPGFGCSISDAVRASCSATPFFEPCHLDLKNDGKIEARDGGFCANNPSLFAAADALYPLKTPADQIRLLSVGVGHYPQPRPKPFAWLIQKLPSVQLLQTTLNLSANTAEIQVRLLIPQVPHIRVSDRFEVPQLATDLLETDLNRLNLLVQKGRESFSERERQLQTFFSNYGKN